MKPAIALAAALTIGFAAPAPAADGVLIAQKITGNGKTTTHSTQIEKTRMRSEIDQGDKKVVMIFDAANGGVLRTIDEANKTYTELTKADVDRMADQMAGAMAKMRESLEKLPPEQRARMEAMMQGGRGMIGAIAGPPPEYKKIGSDTVGPWHCDKYEGTKNGEKSSEVCTVPPAALGLALSDFDAPKQLAEFFARMVPSGMETMLRVGMAGPSGFTGIPVRTVTFRNGSPQATIEMTEATRQNFPEALFTVPAGFKKRDMPGARGKQ